MKKFFVVCGFLVCLFVASIVGNTNANENNINKYEAEEIFNLYIAIFERDLETVKSLALKNNQLNINVRYNDITAFHLAVVVGDLKIIEYLYEIGAGLNTQDYYGKTPTHHAVENRHTDVIKFLLEKDANVEIKDSKNLKPLDYYNKRSQKDTNAILSKLAANKGTCENYFSMEN